MLLPVLVIFCVLFALWLRTRQPGNFPPGPPCIPLVGSLLSMPRGHLHITMMEWKDKYGPLAGLMMGSQPLVMACGPSAVREILRRDEFQGRPDWLLFRERSFNKRLGVILSDGPYWAEQRRFTLRHLCDLGFSKSIMATIMHNEFDELSTEMKEQGIVQDSLLTANLYGLLHDKEHWGDPEVFRPGRFLDNQGNFVKDEWLSIFGMGKRACLGEAFAKNSLFVFFACLLQEFSFSLTDGDPQPSTWPLSGITVAPQPFRAQVFSRT